MNRMTGFGLNSLRPEEPFPRGEAYCAAGQNRYIRIYWRNSYIMVKLNEIGKQCPIPVIETKKAIEALGVGECVETTVDNEIASQNLKKFASQRGYEYSCEEISASEYRVMLTVTKAAKEILSRKIAGSDEADYQECTVDRQKGKKPYIVAISSDAMGEPERELGKILMKGFIYALSKKDDMPKRIIFYNGGARLTCEGSDSLEDLKMMEKSGVEILTCGTCLKFQNLEDKLAVGGVTNMYDITEALTGDAAVVKPC